MNESHLYAGKGGDEGRKTTNRVLRSYFHLVKWHSDRDNFVMDLGCGPAATAVNILLPMFPVNVVMTGCDISEEMIKYAKTHHRKTNLDFMVLDVGTKNLPKELFGKFDQMFSFYCLHWIQDQRQAFTNVFDMLQPGGSLLASISGRVPVFEAYLKLKSDNKWKNYFKKTNKLTSPYHFDTDEVFARRLRKIMEDVGLIVEVLEITHDTFVYENSEHFQAFARSLNTADIPEELFPEYLDLLEKLVIVERNNLTGSCVPHTIQVASVLARKPLEIEHT